MSKPRTKKKATKPQKKRAAKIRCARADVFGTKPRERKKPR
ncbi:MAG TPA: hypothetical protein VKU61_11155 [Candidatus Binatia bacterium]|nr:hypothetical protein [Candidatus Binatia bacterium]